MKRTDMKFVNAADMENLEQYAAALLWGVISLQTLASFHIHAAKKGLLTHQDEQEGVATLDWEIKRLIGLYKNQLEIIQERTPIDQAKMLRELSKVVPNAMKKKEYENDTKH